jgi:N12 class adenine-specific DNA methylase
MVDVHDQLNATQRARVTGLCAIRDHARALLDAQLADEGDSRLGHLRAMLNGTYDRFVARYGCLSTRANALAFRRDPDYPLLLSLEHYDEESGHGPQGGAVHAGARWRRVVEPSTAGEPAEALAASVQWRGRVDPAYMARTAVGARTGGAGGWPSGAGVPRPGRRGMEDRRRLPVGQRQGEAQAGGAVREYLPRNIDALEQVQPEDLPPAAIEPRLGAVWIPAVDVEAFIQQVWNSRTARWATRPKPAPGRCATPSGKRAQNVKVTQEFGTSRMNAIELVQCALNVQVPTVRDRDPGDRQVFRQSRRDAGGAREAGPDQGAVRRLWAFEDAERREKLCRIYNDLFNATRPRQLRWLAPEAAGILPLLRAASAPAGFGVAHRAVRQHRAVPRRRCRQDGGVRHRRHGVAPAGFRQQALPCGPQPHAGAVHGRVRPALSERVGADGGKEDLEGDRRRELVSRIATGDWDAVVITHSSFERIRMSPHSRERFIKEIIHEIEMAVRAEKSNDRSNRIVKQLEAMKKNWAVRLEKLLADQKKDDLLTWEQLGIDALFVDEAHLHKNLYRFTKMTRVAGLPLTNSERAFDLFLKTRYTMQLTGGARSAAWCSRRRRRWPTPWPRSTP